MGVEDLEVSQVFGCARPKCEAAKLYETEQNWWYSGGIYLRSEAPKGPRSGCRGSGGIASFRTHEHEARTFETRVNQPNLWHSRGIHLHNEVLRGPRSRCRGSHGIDDFQLHEHGVRICKSPSNRAKPVATGTRMLKLKILQRKRSGVRRTSGYRIFLIVWARDENLQNPVKSNEIDSIHKVCTYIRQPQVGQELGAKDPARLMIFRSPTTGWGSPNLNQIGREAWQMRLIVVEFDIPRGYFVS